MEIRSKIFHFVFMLTILSHVQVHVQTTEVPHSQLSTTQPQTTEPPTTEPPTTETPTTEPPTTEPPTTEPPTTEPPTTEPPTTEPPTTEPPTTEPPTTEPPTTEPPTTEPSTTEPPTTEPPTTEPPTTEPPTTEPPTTEPPTTESPTTEPPTTELPTTEPPATKPPTTEPPTTEPPTTGLPTTESSTTKPPITEPPTTEPPTTEPPTTEPPTTELPTTELPTTEPPTTKLPTTELPTTEPSTTGPPTTEPPTAKPPTTKLPTTEVQTSSVCTDVETTCEFAKQNVPNFCNESTAVNCSKTCGFCTNGATTNMKETTTTPLVGSSNQPSTALPTSVKVTSTGASTNLTQNATIADSAANTTAPSTTAATIPKVTSTLKPNKAVNIVAAADGEYNMEFSVALLGAVSADERPLITVALNKTLTDLNVMLEKIAISEVKVGTPKNISFVQLTKITWKLKVDSPAATADHLSKNTLTFGQKLEQNLPMSVFSSVYNNNDFEFEEAKAPVNNDAISTTKAPHVWKTKDDVAIGATIAAVALLLIAVLASVCIQKKRQKAARSKSSGIPYNYDLEVQASPRNSVLDKGANTEAVNNNEEASSKL